MAFPFLASFERSIKTVVTPENKDQLLSYIKGTILEEKADNVVVEDMAVRYKGSTGGRGSIFNTVDSGIFSLVCKDDNWFVDYQMSMHNFVMIALVAIGIIEILLTLGDGPWAVHIVALFWPFGLAWVVEMGRHGALAGDLAAGIDHLSGAAPEEPEEDKMTGPLKSWF